MKSEIWYQDATTLAALIRSREISPVEVVQAHLERIEAVNPKLNAIVTIADGALEAAKVSEAAVLQGRELGPLHGVPFSAKDSIDTAGIPTQRGSLVFKDRIPVTDATTVARLKAAGGILLAKTNLPEFSYSFVSDNLLTGCSNNPWDLQRTPGGSSGGEAAAIAAGMSPLGLGTDLGNSLRGPAAQTGIVSLKATHGLVPMTGIWPRTPRRFWHVGPMARSIRDLALAFSLLSGPDGLDAFSTIAAQSGAKPEVSRTRKLRVGWMTGPGLGPVDPEVAATVSAAAESLKSIGCLVDQVQIPALERDFANDIFNRLHVMEMKPVFAAATSGHNENELHKVVKSLLTRPDVSMEDYIEAEHAVERLRDGYAEFFTQYDALITQVLPIPAHKHGIEALTIDGQTVDMSYLRSATVPLNVTGLPGISMRFGTSAEGLPINVQIVGSWHAESTVLHLAAKLEELSPVRHLHPSI
jgi:aspartyl-tRNA(Asn)/glutamyl-tRNA(Gln) amidotransferase subunit A